MPDIAMCLDHECPSRARCLRYTSKPDSHWQSYSYFGRATKESSCEYFEPNVRGAVPQKDKK